MPNPPYSDNLYSGLDEDDVEDEVVHDLSPADGYFHASASPTTSSPLQQYPGPGPIPSVPNVLVEDPTLREQNTDLAADTKAREAAEESRMNSSPPRSSSSNLISRSSRPLQVGDSPSPYPATSSSHHHMRRSVEEDYTSIHPLQTSYNQQQQQQSVAATQSYFDPGTPTRAERSLFPAPSDAPPAYTPRSPPASSSTQGSGYQTFGGTGAATISSSIMRGPDETQHLLPRQPESMGGPSSAAPQVGPHWWYWDRTKEAWERLQEIWGNQRSRRMITGAIIGILLVVITLIVPVVVVVANMSHRTEPDDSGGDFYLPPGVELPSWDDIDICYNPLESLPTIRKTIDLGSDGSGSGRSITIQQLVTGNDRPEDLPPRWTRKPLVFGNLTLRPATDDSSWELTIEAKYNDDSIRVIEHIEESNQVYKITTPRTVPWWHGDGSPMPCVAIHMTLYVPRHEKLATLRKLEAKLEHLNIRLEKGFNLSAKDEVNLSTVTGNVTAAAASSERQYEQDEYNVGSKSKVSGPGYKLSSREISISTVSGDIKGSYPLWDLLRLHSTSGDITPHITTKSDAVDQKDPRDAVLDVYSVSGKVDVKEMSDEAPSDSLEYRKETAPRNHVVKMTTTSGDISADLNVGSSSSFISQSGTLDLNLNLLQSDTSSDSPIHLFTDTKSSDVRLHLHQPEHPPPAPLGSLSSSHHTISGRQDITFPASWTGHLAETTLSGKLEISGPGLEIDSKSGPVPIIHEAHKGGGGSRAKVDSISGDQRFVVS